MYRQFVLRADGNYYLTCWLKDDHRLQLGTSLTLKDDPLPERQWRVWERYSKSLDAPPERKWKVGGLL